MIQKLACSNDWLDTTNAAQTGQVNAVSNYTTAGVTNALGQISPCFSTFQGNGYWWPNSYYPVHVSSPARPIKLLLSEVERLRKAAKDDAKLKAILQKFTSQIEITVDFE